MESTNTLNELARRKEYAESFKRASLDPEMKSMAEEGLEDYMRCLICLEK